MKKSYLLIVSLIAFTAFGLDHDKTDTYYNHLKEINNEWVHYSDACPEGTVSFKSDQERISLHLQLVCQYLLEHSSSDLTSSQLENRIELIEELKIYGETGVFPTNHYHQIRTPYFVDNYNVHCAVGYMMSVSGNKDLVASIRTNHNFDYIENIKTEGVVEWADKYGFTLEELKWIQPGYPPQTLVEPVGLGTNGPVYDIYSDGQKLIISGEFSMLDGLPCLNIGIFSNNQLECLGNGLTGTVNGIFETNEGIFAYGELNYGPDTYPLAMFDGNQWNYIDIPNRSGAVAHAGNHSLGTSYIVVISHPSNPGNQEIWHNHFQDGWVLKAHVNGEIYDIANSTFQSAYAGRFDEVVLYDNMIADSVFTTSNLIIKSNYFEDWSGVVGEVSDTIKTICFVGSTLYAGGNSSLDSLKSHVALVRYLNGSLQTVITRSDFSSGLDHSINDLKFDQGNRLLIAGYFSSPNFMLQAAHVGYYHLTQDFIQLLAKPDKAAHAIVDFNGAYYFGGEFTTQWSTQLNHLAKVIDYSNVPEYDSEFTVFPNPFIDQLQINGNVEGEQYIILDLSGKEIKKGIVENQNIVVLNELPKGTYILSLFSGENPQTAKIIKH